MYRVITDLFIVGIGTGILATIISLWITFALHSILINGWDIDSVLDILKSNLAKIIPK